MIWARLLSRSFFTPDDVRVIGYYFVPELKKSLQRNQQRSGNARVPNVAIFATAKRLVRPTYTEGFAQLFLCKPVTISHKAASGSPVH
jgi:hypothetical protein